jgi:hypothetical protein
MLVCLPSAFSLRFAQWGLVPNDVKPLRYGNRLNRKRRKHFVW